MRQRVGIAQALLNDPALLIVDEPTVGLDPEERMRFRHLLTDLAGQRLVILSTHIVSDVEASATALEGGLSSSGALGPIFTPASLGHAIPTTNPRAAMIPTRDHAGPSSGDRGISTLSGTSCFAIRLAYHKSSGRRK